MALYCLSFLDLWLLVSPFGVFKNNFLYKRPPGLKPVDIVYMSSPPRFNILSVSTMERINEIICSKIIYDNSIPPVLIHISFLAGVGGGIWLVTMYSSLYPTFYTTFVIQIIFRTMSSLNYLVSIFNECCLYYVWIDEQYIFLTMLLNLLSMINVNKSGKQIF